MNTAPFKQRLEEEKQKLETELATVARKNPSNPQDWEPVPAETGQEADPNDQASIIDSYGENAAILRDLENRYNDVLAALTRIEDRTYGVCETGGEEIEEARLNADPAARTCRAHLA